MDGSSDNKEARDWIDKMRTFLDLSFTSRRRPADDDKVQSFVEASFPPAVRLALLQLPLSHLSKQPLMDLLKGFEIDLLFSEEPKGFHGVSWPIRTESDLEQYAKFVAGTVAELCIDLVLHHGTSTIPVDKRQELKAAGRNMGIALQLVNIARDIKVDADMSRVYIPSTWLKTEGVDPKGVLKEPTSPSIVKLRLRLLDKAFECYEQSRGAIEELPLNARGPMRVAVESYMEIGRVLRKGNHRIKAGRATVPKFRRLLVAWRTLNK